MGGKPRCKYMKPAVKTSPAVPRRWRWVTRDYFVESANRTVRIHAGESEPEKHMKLNGVDVWYADSGSALTVCYDQFKELACEIEAGESRRFYIVGVLVPAGTK